MKPKKYRNIKQETPPLQKKPGGKSGKLKKAIILFGLSALAYAALKVMLEYGLLWAFIMFELLAGIPIIAYVIAVRGRLGKLPLIEELPDEWSEIEKTEFLETEKQRKNDGKIYLYIAFPFIAAVLVAFVTEFYFPMLFG